MIPKKLFAFEMLLLLFGQMCLGQGSAGSGATLESRYLIDVPTAGMLAHGNLALDMDFYQEGGVLTGISLGAFDRLLFGVSYGGTRIIGNVSPTWNQIPGFSFRFRIIEETMFLPAIALGFDSQGKGPYFDSLNRYAIKSPGFYASASKNYDVFGYLSIHGGVNYSLERSDGDKDPNFFMGAEKSLGPMASIIGEYNLGFNDSNHEALGRGRGYVNFGLRASIGGGFTLGVNLKDVIKNQQDISVGNRTIQLEYVRNL